MSSSQNHPELVEMVDEYELPDLYGGNCSCKATCIYSEKGPWSEVENRVNYQKPDECSDEDDDDEEFKQMDLKGLNKGFENMLRDVSVEYLSF